MVIRIDQIQSAGRRSISSPTTIMEAKQRGIKTAFLSYSQFDSDMALKLETLLNDAGLRVYIEYRGEDRAERLDREIAMRTKVKIVATDLFLFLATANSANSWRCPWEVGFADAMKHNEQIVVVPTTDGFKTYGANYMDLYRRVDTSSLGRIGLWRAGARTGAYPMESIF